MATKKTTQDAKKSTTSRAPAKKGATAPEKRRPAGAPKKKQSAPKASSAPKGGKTAQQAQAEEQGYLGHGIAFQIAPFFILIIAILLVIAFIVTDAASTVGYFGVFKQVLFGLFSIGAWLIPVFMINTLISWKRDYENRFIRYKVIFSFLCIVMVSVLAHLIKASDMNFDVKVYYEMGQEFASGGVVGGVVAYAFVSILKPVGSYIVVIPLTAVFAILLFGHTPLEILRGIYYYMRDAHDAYAAREPKVREPKVREPKPPVRERAPERPVYTQQKFRIKPDSRTALPPMRSRKLPVIDISLPRESKKAEEYLVSDEDMLNKTKIPNVRLQDNTEVDIPVTAPISAPAAQELVKPDENAFAAAKAGNFAIEDDKVNLDEIFGEGADNIPPIDISAKVEELELEAIRAHADITADAPALELTTSRITDIDPAAEVIYAYPPISFLIKDTTVSNVDEQDELRGTAERLVASLESFKVKTKITGISRGPRIVRYELQPEVGVKVNAIRNLADDIALSLASNGGIRIEAPIPGKAAVGIEVPKKNPSIVYLRTLIEDDRFGALGSRLAVCLGVDVAGMPIYFDIAKMPHLLIAGATGMGKSVCINSIIMSILYKSSPKEVKMILVDPKKVELRMYNSLPHLLVPVVSDPKKAAGTLAWAVMEMENRFTLIEEQGVRDIAGYNKLASDDPEMDYMPQIVIIIDELADLMMTAKNEVEESICRIAQKARAAGMHLIIGTQRPSVDVITGLIKANIPSRIAFTVASQVDSRTIIDVAGAERLIGSGDMLFAPVGASKPIRVQGSLVSDKEVEAVCTFLRSNHVAEYDEEVESSIEKEAAKCGVKGSKSGSDAAVDGGNDDFESEPNLKKAIELAIEMQTISVSLLQRRLSLGYARAARIVDTMEQLGVVGPFEGSKPRAVLMTRAQFDEMLMRQG